MRYLIVTYMLIILSGCTNKIEQTLKSDSLSARENFIDALDPGSWSGLVLVDKERQAVGFRFGTYAQFSDADSITYTSGKELDYKPNWFNNGDSLYHSVSKVGVKSATGSYANLQWHTKGDQWDLQWGKKENNAVVGILKKIKVKNSVSGIVVECYFPWDYQGELIYSGTRAVTSLQENFGLKFDQAPDLVCATKDSLLYRHEVISLLNNKKIGQKKGKFLYLIFDNVSQLTFLATLGNVDKPNNFEDFESYLQIAKQNELQNRMHIEGDNEDVIPAIVDNLNWMTSFIPHTNYTYIPAGRTWDWGGWAMFEWDSFFNSLLLSVENREMALQNLKSLYGMTQYDNGNLPNYQSGLGGTPDHSQPPIGSYVVWKLYQKTGDRRFLEISYEPLKKWYNWWRTKTNKGSSRRDGNGDGLMEWGADQMDDVGYKPNIKAAMVESGMDDSPLFDDTTYVHDKWTMNMNALDLNSLQALDAEHMAYIANTLGHQDDKILFEIENKRIKELVNEKMWDEESGFYYDLNWDGTFSKQKAPTNFYPLLAGIPSIERAEKMIQKYKDTTLFYGNYMLPTISKDNPEYEDQQYWRGSAWPPVNYLCYQSLKRYHYDDLAGDLAIKSSNMFMNANRNEGGACYENFNTKTGKGRGQKYQSWGPLFALVYLEEIADFEVGGGLRIGSFELDNYLIKKLKLDGKNWDISQKNDQLNIHIDGDFLLNTSSLVVMRNVKYEPQKKFKTTLYSKTSGTLQVENKRVQYQPGKNLIEVVF